MEGLFRYPTLEFMADNIHVVFSWQTVSKLLHCKLWVQFNEILFFSFIYNSSLTISWLGINSLHLNHLMSFTFNNFYFLPLHFLFNFHYLERESSSYTQHGIISLLLLDGCTAVQECTWQFIVLKQQCSGSFLTFIQQILAFSCQKTFRLQEGN